jgi:acrylyl-CoA reductase (NADPH)
MARGGSIALSGNAGGFALNTTVLPFILRGVNILGIDSNLCPLERRREAWRRLATQLPLEMVEAMTQEISLADVPAFSQEILQGKVRGRTVISLE